VAPNRSRRPTAHESGSADGPDEGPGFHDEIKNGKSWTDVTTEVKAVQGANEQDIGMTAKAGLSLEPDITEAIFGLAKPNDITDVFKGTDGIYRFATVTSISAAYADQGWQQAMSGDYQSFVRGLAVTQAVTDAVNKKYIDSPTVQRHVLEIAIGTGYGQPGNGDEFKISLMSSRRATARPAPRPWPPPTPPDRCEGAGGRGRGHPAGRPVQVRLDGRTRRSTTTRTGTRPAARSVDPVRLFNAQTQAATPASAHQGPARRVRRGPPAEHYPRPDSETSRLVVVSSKAAARPLQRIADAQLKIATARISPRGCHGIRVRRCGRRRRPRLGQPLPVEPGAGASHLLYSDRAVTTW